MSRRSCRKPASFASCCVFETDKRGEKLTSNQKLVSSSPGDEDDHRTGGSCHFDSTEEEMKTMIGHQTFGKKSKNRTPEMYFEMKQVSINLGDRSVDQTNFFRW